MKTTSPREILENLGLKIYCNEEVLKEAPIKQEPEKIEFFCLGKYVTQDELVSEYASRGLIPADLHSLAVVNETHLCTATIWKDEDGNWCYATFYRWRGERSALVRRRASDWDGDWSFAGVPQVSALETNPLSSDTLNLERAIKVVKDAGYRIFKEV